MWNISFSPHEDDSNKGSEFDLASPRPDKSLNVIVQDLSFPREKQTWSTWVLRCDVVQLSKPSVSSQVSLNCPTSLRFSTASSAQTQIALQPYKEILMSPNLICVCAWERLNFRLNHSERNGHLSDEWADTNAICCLTEDVENGAKRVSFRVKAGFEGHS